MRGGLPRGEGGEWLWRSHDTMSIQLKRDWIY